MVAAFLVLALGGVACDVPEAPSEGLVLPEGSPPDSLSARELPRRWRAGTEHPGLRWVVLEVGAARLAGDGLRLEVSFVNTSERSFAVAGELGGGSFRLLEPGGRELEPLAWSAELERLDGGEALAPRAERHGWVTFPRPVGEIFELSLGAFETIILERRHLMVDSAGTVLHDTVLHDTVLHGKSEKVDAEKVTGSAEALLIRASLEAQARAMTSYDLDAYLETFAPAARQAERRAFLRLRPFPIAKVWLEKAPDEDLRRAGGGRLHVVVELGYQLEGVPPDNPFVHRLRYVFAPSVDGLLVEAIFAVDEGEVPVWRQGDLVLHRTNHFLILTQPSLRGDLVELAADAEAAWAALKQKGLSMESGYVLHFVARADAFQRLAGHPKALGVAVGRYTLTAEGYAVDSRAIYVNGPVFARRRGVAAEVRRATVTHELVHLALAKDSRPFTPAWLKEGVAVFFSDDVSYDANRWLVEGGLERFHLPAMTRASALGLHDAEGSLAAAEYLFSGDVVAWLVQQQGRQRLLEFYRSYAQVPATVALAVSSVRQRSWWRVFDTDPVGTLATELTESALEQHYGLDLESLEAAVKDRLRVRHR